MKRIELKVSIDFTPKEFWAILPALNINIHNREFEFEWLCLGIYIGKQEERKSHFSDFFMLDED